MSKDEGYKKPAEPDDPMMLQGVAIPDGDEEEMMEAIIEEFARLGMPPQKIFTLFRSPRFSGTHAFCERHGEEATWDLIKRVVSRSGVMRYEVEILDTEGGRDA